MPHQSALFERETGAARRGTVTFHAPVLNVSATLLLQRVNFHQPRTSGLAGAAENCGIAAGCRVTTIADSRSSDGGIVVARISASWSLYQSGVGGGVSPED